MFLKLLHSARCCRIGRFKFHYRRPVPAIRWRTLKGSLPEPRPSPPIKQPLGPNSAPMGAPSGGCSCLVSGWAPKGLTMRFSATASPLVFEPWVPGPGARGPTPVGPRGPRSTSAAPTHPKKNQIPKNFRGPARPPGGCAPGKGPDRAAGHGAQGQTPYSEFKNIPMVGPAQHYRRHNFSHIFLYG